MLVCCELGLWAVFVSCIYLGTRQRAWRKNLLGIRDLIRLGAKLHRALLLVSIGSLTGSAAAWDLGGVLMAAFLGLGVLSFFFSTYLRQFNFEASR